MPCSIVRWVEMRPCSTAQEATRSREACEVAVAGKRAQARALGDPERCPRPVALLERPLLSDESLDRYFRFGSEEQAPNRAGRPAAV